MFPRPTTTAMETISLLHKSRKKQHEAFIIPAKVSEQSITVDFDEVKSLKFSTVISLKSLLWALIFFLFFLDLCLRRNPDNWFFSSMAAMAVGFVVLSFIFLDKQYYISLCMTDGTKLKIKVPKDNKEVAETFVIEANEKITKK